MTAQATMYQNRAAADPVALQACTTLDWSAKLGVMAMRVLVAGDRGYIGAIMVPFLRAAGHQVSGLDLGLYEGCDFGSGPEEADERPPCDIRACRGRTAGGL